MAPPPTWTSFVALGDSFTEGLYDPAPDGSNRGWADRVAERLAGLTPEFRYANLAIRGRVLRQIVDEQVPVALQMRPALVSFCAGANDMLRRRADLTELADRFEAAVAAFRAAGADVLLFTLGQPSRRHRMIRSLDGRFAALNEIVERVAVDYGCLLIPTGAADVFNDPRLWCDDRMHLNSEGHARVAGAVFEQLGLGDAGWRMPLSPARPPLPLRHVLAGDLLWTQRHYAPWIYRRLRGLSTGHGLAPKRPVLQWIGEPLSESWEGIFREGLREGFGGSLGGAISGSFGGAAGGPLGDALGGGAEPAVADG